MAKFFKVLFVAAPAAVVFFAVAEARGGHRGDGGPPTQKDVRLV